MTIRLLNSGRVRSWIRTNRLLSRLTRSSSSFKKRAAATAQTKIAMVFRPLRVRKKMVSGRASSSAESERPKSMMLANTGLWKISRIRSSSVNFVFWNQRRSTRVASMSRSLANTKNPATTSRACRYRFGATAAIFSMSGSMLKFISIPVRVDGLPPPMM